MQEHVICDSQHSKPEIQTFYKQILVSIQSEATFSEQLVTFL